MPLLTKKIKKIMSKQAPKCAECGTTFSRNAALTRHMLIHSQVRRFRCEQCDKAFVQPGDLTRHIGTHQKNYQHECVDCGAKFQRPFDLKRHRGHAKGISMCPKRTGQRRMETLAPQQVDNNPSGDTKELAGHQIASSSAQDETLEYFDTSMTVMELHDIDPARYGPHHSGIPAKGLPWQVGDKSALYWTLPMRFAEGHAGRGLDDFQISSDNHGTMGAPDQTGTAHQSMPTDSNFDFLPDGSSYATASDAGLLDMMSIDGAAWTPHDSSLLAAGPSTIDPVNFQLDLDCDSLQVPNWDLWLSMALPFGDISDLRPKLRPIPDGSHPVNSLSLTPRHKRASRKPKIHPGCFTCRVLRIKCDKQKPQCGSCRRSGRVCESYERRAFEALRYEASPQTAIVDPSDACDAQWNPVPLQPATVNLMASGGFDRYSGVDLASLARNVAVSWFTTYKYWTRMRQRLDFGNFNRNEIGAIFEKVRLSTKIIFGDIYVNLLHLTLRLYRSVFGHSQGWGYIDELKALILLTQLLLDFTCYPDNSSDEAAFRAHHEAHTRALRTLYDSAQDEFGQVVRYDTVRDVTKWWEDLTGIISTWRWTEWMEFYEELDASAPYMYFPSLLWGTWFFVEKPSVMTPELDKGLQQLEICFGTGPWSYRTIHNTFRKRMSDKIGRYGDQAFGLSLFT